LGIPNRLLAGSTRYDGNYISNPDTHNDRKIFAPHKEITEWTGARKKETSNPQGEARVATMNMIPGNVQQH